MNHIPYELALTRRDELLRQAAEQRLASRAARSVKGVPRPTPMPQLRGLRPRRWLRFAVRG